MICNNIGSHSTPLLGCHFTGQVQTATASGEEKDQLAAEITTALTQEPVVGELVSLGAILGPPPKAQLGIQKILL